jgi:hypothetical protein
MVALSRVCTDNVEPAVGKAINSSSSIAADTKEATHQRYIGAATGKSNADARAIAQDILGEPVYWDWDCEHDILIITLSADRILSAPNEGGLLPFHWRHGSGGQARRGLRSLCRPALARDQEA